MLKKLLVNFINDIYFMKLINLKAVFFFIVKR